MALVNRSGWEFNRITLSRERRSYTTATGGSERYALVKAPLPTGTASAALVCDHRREDRPERACSRRRFDRSCFAVA